MYESDKDDKKDEAGKLKKKQVHLVCHVCFFLLNITVDLHHDGVWLALKIYVNTHAFRFYVKIYLLYACHIIVFNHMFDQLCSKQIY